MICPLLCPKFSVEKIHFCGKMLRETDIIDLVNCTFLYFQIHSKNIFNTTIKLLTHFNRHISTANFHLKNMFKTRNS